jgi:NDP-sugar pyrophosphorylase family protein
MTQPIAAILAAGLGSRMAPITHATPKPLIPFLNTPTIAYPLGLLPSVSPLAIVLNTHHLHLAIPPVVSPLCQALGLPAPSFTYEPTLLGTAGGLVNMWRSLGSPDAPLIVLNSDSVSDLDLQKHLQEHLRSGADATLIVRPKDPKQPGRVWLDHDLNICGLRDARRPGSPHDSHLVEHDFTGVHILSPSLLKDLPIAPACMVADVYIPALLMRPHIKLRASLTHGFWAALDNPSLYLDAMRRVLQEPSIFPAAPLPPISHPTLKNIHIWRTADLDPHIKLGAPALLGLNVRADAGARIGPNACIDGAHLEADCVVQNAALFGVGRISGDWIDCIAIGDQIVSL